MLDEFFRDLDDDLEPSPTDPEQQTLLAALIRNKSIECSFFVLIIIPCLLIHRTSPTRLYRKARQGDFSARAEKSPCRALR